MQLSTVEVFISNTTHLFSLKTSSLFIPVRKNLILSTLCLMPLAVTVHAEEAATATHNAATNTTAPATQAAPTTQVPTAAPVTTESATPAPVAITPINDLHGIILAKQHPYLAWTDFTHRADDLDALYKAGHYQPIWLNNDVNKAQKNIGEVIKLLEDAASHGLKATDYEVALLKEKLATLKTPVDLTSKDASLYDTAISLSLLRFAHDLHYGRINPRDLHRDIQKRTEKTLNLPELILSNLAQNSLDKIPSLVEPKLPQYQKLKQALAARQGGEKVLPFKLEISSTIRPNNPFPKSVELQQFLASIGDLPADKVDLTATTYTDSTAEAIKKYQQRHGLKANGLLNKATAKALSTPANAQKGVSQIELAMERLRWLPDINEGRAIMVNIPAFQLMAFDDVTQDIPAKTMRVVVGKAAKHQTPILTASMQFVDFQPYWHVPLKIARDEILPKLAENPDYLAGHNMEVISRSGKRLGGGLSYAAISQGTVGIRQKPGTGNALGKVKFLFPNKSDVYLHDTPSVGLFSRARRDLSHGCVRVAEPQALAEFVLKDESDWDTDHIKKAMRATGKNRRVILKDTIPVLFLYNTVFIDQHNNLAFYADIYGHDEKLSTALKKSRKDLADADLIAPKEVLPPTEEQGAEKIEAQAPTNPQLVTPATSETVATSKNLSSTAVEAKPANETAISP